MYNLSVLIYTIEFQGQNVVSFTKRTNYCVLSIVDVL